MRPANHCLMHSLDIELLYNLLDMVHEIKHYSLSPHGVYSVWEHT